MNAKYCKCKNTYTISGCNKERCDARFYWRQGIGGFCADNLDYLTTEDGKFITTEDGIKITV
jgi:hypothetical protein